MANENLTEERINWLIDYFSSDAVSLYAGIDVVQLLREVQQGRKADGEPMGFIWKNERGEDVAVLGAPPAAWSKFSTRLLYAAPQPASVVLEELLAAMEDVLRISDRDHDAWSRAKLAIGDCRAAMLQAVNSPIISDGWMLVPKEPTREMVQTVADEVHPAVFVRAVYKTMIAAAPRFISFTCSIK